MLKPLGDRIVIKVIEDTNKLQAEFLLRTVLKKNLKKVKSLLSEKAK